MKNIFTKKYFIMLGVMILISLGAFNLVSGAETNPFPDVPNTHWAIKNVENLYAKKLINGYEDGLFKGDNKLRACEFIKMLVCYYDYETGDTTVDAGPNEPWFKKYHEKAVGIGIIDRSKDYDGYEYSLSREEAVQLMYNTLTSNVEVMDFTQQDGRLKMNFTDKGQINSNYLTAITDLYNCGIVDGYDDGSFKPQGILSRYESVKLLDVFMSKSVRLIKPKNNVTNDIYQVVYEYEDDGIPGHGYKVKFNVPRKTVSIFTTKHSSAIDVPEGRYAYNIDWSMDEVWYTQVQELFANRYKTDKDSFGILLEYISNIGSKSDKAWASSTDNDWDTYKEYDLNKDGKVTIVEYSTGKLTSYMN